MYRLLVLLTAFIIIITSTFPASANTHIRVYYAGPQDNGVYVALAIAPKGSFSFVSDLAQADVFVLNGIIPDPAGIAPYVQRGAGLVLIFGPGFSAANVETVSGIPVKLSEKTNAISLTNIKIDDPLVQEILWNSSPQVRERTEIQTPLSSVQPLVTACDNSEWVLWAGNRPNIYFFNAYLTNFFDLQTRKIASYNPQIQEWTYFNYLIYQLVERAAGYSPFTFADYLPSPVPHTSERTILPLLMGLMFFTTFGAFFLVRRYSMRHPE